MLQIVSVLILIAFTSPQALPHVVVQTDLGEIELEIDTVRAPATAANFLKYVDAGLYDGGLFHRTVRPDNQREKPIKIAVIQGAANAARKSEFFPPIALERTNKTGVLHKDGTVSMARAGVDTATEEFFICVGDQPELDFGGKRNPDGQGFAAFGRVVRGIDIVRRIQESTADGETLRPPVKILSVRRLTPRL
jgi:peptidyl-prolyl cis-trans isomerase A (cyclophilin A)